MNRVSASRAPRAAARGSGRPPFRARFDAASLSLRALAVLLLALAVAAGATSAGLAQSIPAPPPTVLIDISAKAGGHGETQLLLTFAPQAPTFSIIDNDTDHPSIAFGPSSRGSSARIQSPSSGLLRSVSFEQSQSVLVIHMALAAKAHLTATPSGAAAIALALAPAVAENAAAAGPTLPRNVETPEAEDGFELVPLKYADISEVVGLLTNGQTIKSNDTFTPEEPNFGTVGATSGSAISAQNANTESAGDSLAQSVDDTIGVDRRLNAIILKGPPDRIARLKAKIAQIDVPVQSVLLETVFVELDESGAKNVGLSFANSSSQLAVATFQTGAFEEISPDIYIPYQAYRYSYLLR